MVGHPLDENLDAGLEQALEVLEEETDLETSIEVGEVWASDDETAVTVTIDASGRREMYDATVIVGDQETGFRTSDIEEFLPALPAMVSNPGVQINNLAEDTIEVLKGHMDIYVFEVVEGELRYWGPVNASEGTYSEVPDDVIAFAEEYSGHEVTGDLNE